MTPFMNKLASVIRSGVHRRSGLILGSVLILTALGLSLPSLASLDSVAQLFNQGRYDEARETLLNGGEGTRLGEDVLWRSRLAGNVDEAVEFLEGSRQDERLPVAVQQRMALELAEIYFARSEYMICLEVLSPVLDMADQDIPGEAYLLTGLCYRVLGDLQSAREMLASVKPRDGAFAQARFFLGDISLQKGDQALALRYFQSGLDQDSPVPHPSLMAGQWRVWRTEGDRLKTENTLAQLQHDSPGSLALLDINRIMRDEAEELAARGDAFAQQDSTTTRPQDTSGRYCLQLGAFSDRSLALDFLRRYENLLPDLRVDEIRDDRGQFLYKVRSGSFVNPALARAEAARVKRSLGIDVIVADLHGHAKYND